MELVDGIIPVFGNADENTLRQIRTCARTADKVALMPDNHYGYGVPIGGVVAYKDSISPTGVGYDIGCFVGEQTVELLDGSTPTFRELVEQQANGQEHFGYSVDAELNPVVVPLLNARKTRETTELMHVTLDNGEVVSCTPDHVFYLRDGSECCADALESGVSLLPLYIKEYGDIPIEHRAFQNKRMKLEDYLGVYNPNTTKWELIHHIADDFNMRNGLDASSNGPIRHHRNFNKLDNNPTNIRRMGWKEHFALHSSVARERAAAGEIGFGRAHALHPEFFSKMGSENMTRLHKRPDFVERRDARAMKHMKIMLASDACRENWKNAGERGREGLIAFNRSEEGRQQAVANRKRPAKCKRCGGAFGNHSELLKHYHAEHKGVLNHKVHSVERVVLKEPVPVFCLTVPVYHRFALAAGVFVHNCGNKAVRVEMDGPELRRNIKTIMDDVWSTISFGVGRKNNERVDHALFDDEAWKLKAIAPLKEMASQQLGTVGSGNHYVDLFTDEQDRVWVGVHFGSRGLGHKTATYFLKEAGASDGMDVEPCVLSVGSVLGSEYLEAMRIAGEYAYAGRDWVCDKVASILGAPILESVHNHHNYAWRETHSGEDMWVVRKGATPAFPGQRGFVGGTMAEGSVILEGIENENSKYSLYSTVHGAGRAMGRMEAKGKIDKKTGEVKRAGKVTPEMMDGWVKKAGIELRGAGLDESPDCYKRLDSVLDSCGDSIKIIHRLTPVGVAMASAMEYDPFKD